MGTTAFPVILARSAANAIRMSLMTRASRFRSWPSPDALIDEPLALAEEKTHRLRRIYTNAQRDAWDGPELFRTAVAKHGGIQLSEEKRRALAHPISMLMWGELAAWIVSAELAERLEDTDAKMAASSQVFDEARHFYILRDYLALLHIPVPKLDPYFTIAVRSLLASKDLTLKLFAMQILAEGTAQSIFAYLADAEIEPVLTEILPFIEKDEARHVGLGIMYLPKQLENMSPRECERLAWKVHGIGDLFGATQVRFIEHYKTLGLDPRDLFRKADRMLTGLSKKLGNVPGTDIPYFRTDDPADPDYDKKLDFVLPKEGAEPEPIAIAFKKVLSLGAKVLPT